MRCLVKCLAMFGLGHYIYAGEDLPSAEADKAAEQDEGGTEPAEDERRDSRRDCEANGFHKSR